MRSFVLERASDTVDALHRAAAQPIGNAHVTAQTQYIAGGTTLLDLTKIDVMQPQRLLDISALANVHGHIMKLEDGLWLGAAVRMSQAADDDMVRSDYPVIADALWQAAS